MLYQLPDGRTVEISIEQYLSFSDDDIKALVAYDHGAVINNPMYGSTILKPGRPEPEDVAKEIPDVTTEEKFKDQDYTAEEE